MNSNTLSLKEASPEQIIAIWEHFKPKEPSAPEPLFVWPNGLGFTYLIRIAIYSLKMKRSGWRQFHDEYQQWHFKTMSHYNALVEDCSEQDRYKNPQLMVLWEYQLQAQVRIRENAITQAEWRRRRRDQKRTT